MLALQYFKKAVVEALLAPLLRTGRPEAIFCVLQQRQRSGKGDLLFNPISAEPFINRDSESYRDSMDFFRQAMDMNDGFASCLALPQYMLRYTINQVPKTEFMVGIFDEKGQFNDYVYQLRKLSDEQNLTVMQVLTCCFEYPLAMSNRQMKTWPPGPPEQISGCTFLTLGLRPHPVIGYELHSVVEKGSEYGEILPTELLGRGIRGVPVEETKYKGMSPWNLSTNDAIAVWQGSPAIIPLPDVSRF